MIELPTSSQINSGKREGRPVLLLPNLSCYGRITPSPLFSHLIILLLVLPFACMVSVFLVPRAWWGSTCLPISRSFAPLSSPGQTGSRMVSGSGCVQFSSTRDSSWSYPRDEEGVLLSPRYWHPGINTPRGQAYPVKYGRYVAVEIVERVPVVKEIGILGLCLRVCSWFL